MLQREEQVGKFVGGKVEQNEQISKGKKKLCSAMRMLRMQGSQGESTANFRCSCTYCFLFPPTLAYSHGSLACCKLT